MKRVRSRLHLRFLAMAAAACGGGGSPSGSPTGPSPVESSYDLTSLGVPQFVSQQYTPLANIHQISRFRSSVGHSYTDAAEPCRSMKHYFSPTFTADGKADYSTLYINAPADGTVRSVTPESNAAGVQVSIQPTAQPAFRVILFHVTASTPLAEGTRVTAGQRLGTMTEGTLSDIAVGVNTPQGYRLVSWFDVITESVFQEYRARGVVARADLIISRTARDADPLTCSGETFTAAGTLAAWVVLR